MAWFVWHIDLAWYIKDTTVAAIAKVPRFGAELAICLAKRAAGQSSPFSEKVELHYDSKTKCEGFKT